MPKRNRKAVSLSSRRPSTLAYDGQRSAPTTTQPATQPSAESDRRDICSVTLQLRADSINEEQRSVDAVLATENPVTVYDWSRRQFVDEVLLMAGCQMRDQVPLLNNHQRYSLDDVFGSIREMKVEGTQLVCRLHFADMSEHADDDEARKIARAWTKVKQRHQREISVGYRVIESVTIPANSSQVVAGRKFKAGDRPLRIATNWLPREGSLTPIAADVAATTRKDHEVNPLLTYLATIGLRADATVTEAWDFVSKMTDAGQRSEVQKILAANTNITAPDKIRSVMETWTRSETDQEDNGQRSESGNSPRQQATSEDSGNADQVTRSDLEATVQQQMAAERQRVSEVVRTFADNGVENDALQQRAINEGWSTARVAQEILPMVRQRSSQPVDGSGNVGIHSVRTADSQAVALAVMLRNGTALDNEAYSSPALASRLNPEGNFSRAGSVLAADINSDERQRAMEDAHRLATRYHSLVDLCEQGLRAAGQQVPHNVDEMVRAAVSSSAVQAIFTTDINARLLGSYTTAEDTTQAWTRTEDRNDFKTNTGVTMGKFKGLTIHSAGKTADHLDTDAESYTYKLYRFSGKFELDEMDIIDDRFGALEQMAPEDMGAVAAELRPNMVYALLLSNPTFNGSAVFTSGRNNLFSGGSDAFSLTSLTNAKTQMAKQRIRDRILNLRLKHLLMPFELEGTGDQLLKSIELRDNGAAGTYGTMNPAATKGYNAIYEDRLSAAGVVDPITGTRYAGSATNWFGAAQPGVGGAKTIVVGYRRGTGRQPQTRSYAMTQGRWGMGWDINIDMGCGFEDYRGVQKHAGA